MNSRLPLLLLATVGVLLFLLVLPGCGRGRRAHDTSPTTTAASTVASATSSAIKVPAGESPAPVTPQSSPMITAAPETTPRVPDGAPACAQQRPHAPGSTDVTIDGDRRYILHVPPSYDGTRELPLVINLHGAGSNAIEQAFYSRFQAKADEEGFITLTPDAKGTPQAWNFIPLPSLADDVAFISDALDRTEADLCIDAARVYSTGISSGAAMSVRLACSLSDRIAAIGIVSAIWYPPNCPAKAMPVLEFHGTDDPVVPFNGGSVATSGIPSPPVEDAMAQWAKADGCTPDAAAARFSDHVRTETYTGCRNGVSVKLFVIEGGGHTWPGASVDVTPLGATTHEVDATDQIWQFFSAYARQPAS